MKQNILILISTLFCNMASFGQVSDWIWAKREGGNAYDAATCMVSDASGNIYLAGRFGSLVLTLGTDTFVNADTTGHSYDIFLIKYNANGTVLWAKSLGGTKNDYARSITLDASENIYLAGGYESPILISGSDTMTNAGIYNVFLIKFDNNGNFIWTKSAGGTEDDEAYSVVLDNSGNIYLAGQFSSPTIQFDTTVLINTTSNSGNVFLVKYNTNGNLQWAKSTGGENTTNDGANSLALDSAGNIYMEGHFSSSTINFDSIVLINSGSFNFFITKYDMNGKVIWAQSAGGDGMDEVNSMTMDVLGYIYMTGFFTSSFLNIGSTTLINTDTIYHPRNIFIAKYKNDGTALWARSAGGQIERAEANSIALNATGDAYIAGYFYCSTITFDTTTLANAGVSDIFIAKYDNEGSVLWVKSIGGTWPDWATSIIVDLHGNIYTAGWFNSPSIAFDSNILMNANTTDNNSDIFLAKLSSSAGINEFDNSFDISIFPNPTKNNFTIIAPPATKQIQILNSIGQIIQKTIVDGQTNLNFSLSDSGLYFIQVMTDKKTVTRKLIVTKE
jgi:hypothetical protein